MSTFVIKKMFVLLLCTLYGVCAVVDAVNLYRHMIVMYSIENILPKVCLYLRKQPNQQIIQLQHTYSMYYNTVYPSLTSASSKRKDYNYQIYALWRYSTYPTYRISIFGIRWNEKESWEHIEKGKKERYDMICWENKENKSCFI